MAKKVPTAKKNERKIFVLDTSVIIYDHTAIKHFKEHDVYIKVTGWYQSYNGTEFYDGWGCCSQVFPKQQTITVYE